MVRDIREREIRIWTDGGRVCRPLIIVENGKLAIKKFHIDRLKEREQGQGATFNWDDLVSGGIVEYIDVMEEGQFFHGCSRHCCYYNVCLLQRQL